MEIEPYVDTIRKDVMGNLIATKKGEGPSIMLAAHMDEIGLMVKYIDDNGFLRFVEIGGWFDQTLLSQRVILHGKKGPIAGVIGCKSPHLMKDEAVSYTHLRAHETVLDLVCRLLLEK